jgi:signal transduction histidine kinase
LKNLPGTVYILSADLNLTRSYLKDLASASWNYQVTHVQSVTEALEVFPRSHPAAILFDESASLKQKKHPVHNGSGLAASVALLAQIAPVVVVASQESHFELAALIASGNTDFVARTGNYFPLAARLLERRLRQVEQLTVPPYLFFGDDNGNFGEVLRHEVNNPLTGILGNAELLLAEVRRRDDGRLPEAALQRLQTIAELAVRLRETVRRLSCDLENRGTHARSA